MSPNHLSDSDWSKRTAPISFRRLMHLATDPSDNNTLISTSAAYPPTASPRTYGGHVIAQAAWAAAHTVPHGLYIHSITGYFLAIGDTRYAFRYRVRRLRDGGVYALRVIEVFQDGNEAIGKGPMFMCIMSFKRDEIKTHDSGYKKRRRDFGHQEATKEWFANEYSKVLKKRTFEEWPTTQGMDGMWAKRSMSVAAWKTRGEVFPGLRMKKVDMGGYNGDAPEGGLSDSGEVARRWRLLMLYKLIVDHEDTDADRKSSKHAKTAADDELNLHACAHIYASDRNSLFLAQRSLGFANMTGQMGSLSHTMNFHGRAEECRMLETDGTPKEFVQEAWISNSGDDRVCHESRIWDRESGKIIASTVQDGMMRMLFEQLYEVLDGDLLLRREAKL